MDMAKKLVDGLTSCAENERKIRGSCGRCPYKKGDSCRENLLCDALAYVCMGEYMKHKFDKCVDAKDFPIGKPPEGLEEEHGKPEGND